jgi:hypothetical protein
VRVVVHAICDSLDEGRFATVCFGSGTGAQREDWPLSAAAFKELAAEWRRRRDEADREIMVARPRRSLIALEPMVHDLEPPDWSSVRKTVTI